MLKRLVISKTALKDIDAGINYYQRQQKNLGRRFEQAAHTTFKKIQKFPFAASFAYQTVRYKMISKFPYIILRE